MENKAFDHSKYPDWIDPQRVKPYERNVKEHTEKQIDNIVNSIRRFGWQQDTVITADDVLVIGHGRRLAAIKLGCDMPYHRIDKEADQLTDEDIRELRIADNQTNAETGFDMDLLALETKDLDFEGFNFDFEAPEIVADDESGIRTSTDAVDQEGKDGKAQSKIYICAVSAFGTDSECLAEAVLTEEEAKRILRAAETGGTDRVMECMKGALNDI